ncbi:hypothetical protein ACH4E8_29330 [Streptomyces sp. NPDC017979]|uniref:hypothetical protein n=1 Tax=Streptomyces sp. NPDC017979 TaxID=3365024 RepID=UPI0037954593
MPTLARHRRTRRRRRPGRHTAEYLTAYPPPAPFVPSAWSRPWTGPTKEEARRLFEEQAARARRRLVIAPHGLPQRSAA